MTFTSFSRLSLQEISTEVLFQKKTIVVFAVPGAFTDPFSPIQLLGYNEYADMFQVNGIDEIVCISINDSFSLAAWAQDEKADRIRFLPDVKGEFTHQMGMLTDLSHLGMGVRSRRYSMLVKNSIIEKMFVEPHDDIDIMPIISTAEVMLDYINPNATRPRTTEVLMKMWQAIFST